MIAAQQKVFYRKARLLTFICLIATVFFAQTAQAANPKPTIRDNGHAAQYVSQTISDPITIEAGKTKTVTIKFKNTGTQTWYSLNQHTNGYRHVSAYTMEPRYRDSVFKGSNWLSAKQTASITKDTAPGGIAELKIELKAPNKAGEYREEFYLAAESWTWIKNGYFYLDINVVEASGAVSPLTQTNDQPAADSVDAEIINETENRLARVITQNTKEVSVPGGQEVMFIVVYRNKGDATWDSYQLHAASGSGLRAASANLSFADDSWQGLAIVRKTNTSIEPQEIFRESFTFRAPADKGEYTVTFFLASDGNEIEGSQAHVNVNVTENAPINYTPPTFSDTSVVKPSEPRLEQEPRIRVGLVGEGTTIQVVSYDDDYIVYDGQTKLGELPRRSVAVITHTGDGYGFRGAGKTFTAISYFRLVPKNNQYAVFTILKGLKDRSVDWVGPSEFMRYRGTLEYRKGEVDGQLYVVNDVLLEDYVEGVSETGKGINVEATKANLVAARTYAYISKDKYPFFDVLGSTYDQLYLGDDVKKYLVDVAGAAKATRGQMVTYKGKIVTTPYFGNSNGRTRSWQSVWGGSVKPWLVSVVAKYDAGRRQFGHGVGMSQRDSAFRAKNDGWTSTQLLKHYYTGTEVEVIYR